MSSFPTATPTPGPDDSFGGRAFAPRTDGVVIGTGIDVVGIERLAQMIERTPALLDRLFTPPERELSDASRAARVAAKEAVGKALGAPGDFSWQDVTVERTHARRPYLRLRGATLRSAESQGVGHLHLSLSHDGDVATAIVIAEREALEFPRSARSVSTVSGDGATTPAAPTTTATPTNPTTRTTPTTTAAAVDDGLHR